MITILQNIWKHILLDCVCDRFCQNTYTVYIIHWNTDTLINQRSVQQSSITSSLHLYASSTKEIFQKSCPPPQSNQCKITTPASLPQSSSSCSSSLKSSACWGSIFVEQSVTFLGVTTKSSSLIIVILVGRTTWMILLGATTYPEMRDICCAHSRARGK